MVSRTVLSAIGITVWAAVLVTAAPRVISHRYSEHTVEISSHDQWPAANCNDLHIEFDGRDAVVQSEEKIITKAEAPLLRVQAGSNGGVTDISDNCFDSAPIRRRGTKATRSVRAVTCSASI